MTWSIIGIPPTRCRTFGSADFMRVPFPAASMTMWRSAMAPDRMSRPEDQLSRGTRAGRGPAAIDTTRRRRLESGTKRVVFAQRIEVGIGSREGAILGVYRDCALDVRNGLGELAALGVRNREHIQRVIVVRV